jgi:RNA ligase (TIGR02306 family)
MENLNSVAFVSKITAIKPIDGADNIELAEVGGWNCIIQKNSYTVGQLVILATTDAVIPQSLSDDMNVTNYLRKGQRVKTVKLRGVYSECLIIPFKLTPRPATYKEGDDMMKELNIFKYEPPVKQITLSSGKKIRYSENPNFLIYYKFPNFKNVPDIFTSDDEVQITRKIHGTNARYGIVKKNKLSFFDKLKKFLRLSNRWIEYEFVVGSHNVEKGSDSQGFYETNVWYDISDHYLIEDKLWHYVKSVGVDKIGSGLTIYGEIYGAGIQKGYSYGLRNIQFMGFDVMLDGKYLSTFDAEDVIENKLGLRHVPILYIGKWNKEIQDSFVLNNFIENSNVPHEGIVTKITSGERNKIAKIINPDYLVFNDKNSLDENSQYNH